jgi:hypothetical protein
MAAIEITGFLGILGFIVGLVALVLLFGIVKRTKNEVSHGFLFVLLAVIAFVIVEVVTILELFQIIGHTMLAEIFNIIFVILLVVGMWKLRSLIRGLSDFGQAFVITSKDKYTDTLVSLVKGVHRACVVNLEEPYMKMVDLFEAYGVDPSSIQFLDASGKKCDADNCTNIKNDPEVIKQAVERVLKEQNVNCVVIDHVSAVKKVKKFELPVLIQDTAALIKAHGVQGFFIGKMEHLNKQTINDITMLVDKVIGDDAW